MPRARIIFMGSPAFAVPSLTQLAERPDLCEVVAVVTQPDKPAGRGRKLTPSAIETAAQARRIDVLQPTKMKRPETRDALAAYGADLAVVAAYGRILPQALLDVPRLGCINVHASILPRHRGASPIAHAIIAGDAEAGVSIMQMDAGLDTGPVYSTRAVPIAPDDTCGALTVRLAELGADLLVDTLPRILDGSLQPQPQDDAASTYAPLFAKSDGLVDFSQPGDVLARRIRGLSPWPGAYAFKGDVRVQLLAAQPAAGSGPPGEVLSAGGDGVVIACGDGALRITEVKPAGKKRMAAAAWAAGRGVAIAERFGPPPE